MRELFAEFLRYEPKSGKLFWRKKPARKTNVGSETGRFLHHSGYLCIGFKGRKYWSHRVAWLLHYGAWPKDQIDHIDGNKINNRIENLRDVSQRENHSNYASHRDGRLVGTTFHKLAKKWQAQIHYKGQRKYLGIFATEKLASRAYQKALAEITRENDENT